LREEIISLIFKYKEEEEQDAGKITEEPHTIFYYILLKRSNKRQCNGQGM
jgi:hypothetical protein